MGTLAAHYQKLHIFVIQIVWEYAQGSGKKLVLFCNVAYVGLIIKKYHIWCIAVKTFVALFMFLLSLAVSSNFISIPC